MKLGHGCAAGLMAAALAGCGAGSSAGNVAGDGGNRSADAGASTASDAGATATAWSDRFPTELRGAGPTLKAPSVRPVFFADEEAAKVSMLTDFLSKLAGSAYWTAATSEYGAGALTAAAGVQLVESAPAAIDAVGLRAWLMDAIQLGKVTAPTAGTIYAVYFPKGTVVTDKNGGISCRDYAAYHDEMSVGGQPVAFLAMPHCDSYAGHPLPFPDGPLGGDAFLTAGTSHELVEAATDPALRTDPAFGSIDPAHLAWSKYLFASELSDNCGKQPGALHMDAAIGYVVQSTWSNAAAAAGRDPCVPSAAPYVGAFPRLSKIAPKTPGGGPGGGPNPGPGPGGAVFAVAIADGATATVPVDLASEDPQSAPWTVTPLDYAVLVGGAARVELSLDKPGGKNGDVLQLTIHVISHDVAGNAGFFLDSRLGAKGTRVPVLVVSP